MNVMRYTVIDRRGAVSFVAHCHALTALVAACAWSPTDLREFLDIGEGYYRGIREYVSSGLAVFDEHNTADNPEAIHAALRVCRPFEVPVFRVVDEVTGQASLQPVKAGLILFNLLDKRIVQIMNSYAEIQRGGLVRFYDGERWAGGVFRYELPLEWALVP